MKVRISAEGEAFCKDCDTLIQIDPAIHFEDILLPNGYQTIDPYDLIGKTITHIEESDEVEGALILTLE